MGTRSTYRVREVYRDEKRNKNVTNNICLVYMQFDGYPEGHPCDTARWLAKGTVVNGIGNERKGPIFNGAGCLAAQFVTKFKDGAGGTYLQPLATRGNSGEDYLYDIIVNYDTHAISFVAYETGWGDVKTKRIFKGTPKEFVEKYGNKS